MIKKLIWIGIEEVITALTRNQVTGNRPWVRIPPAPLAGTLDFPTFSGSDFPFLAKNTLIYTLIGSEKHVQNGLESIPDYTSSIAHHHSLKEQFNLSLCSIIFLAVFFPVPLIVCTNLIDPAIHHNCFQPLFVSFDKWLLWEAAI